VTPRNDEELVQSEVECRKRAILFVETVEYAPSFSGTNVRPSEDAPALARDGGI
jgi:hypothetical protein